MRLYAQASIWFNPALLYYDIANEPFYFDWIQSRWIISLMNRGIRVWKLLERREK